MPDQKILDLFGNLAIDDERHARLEAAPAPKLRYLIAMTPRLGSSHLCQVLKNTGRMGQPDELLDQQHIPNIAREAPGRDPDEYLSQAMKHFRTHNGVAGLKASWFQFHDFCDAMADASVFGQYAFIYLTRRDLASQAVSLYRAVESNVFHTNVKHSEAELGKLAALRYDYAGLKVWHGHIVAQEDGWQRYLSTHAIFPLCITYEEIMQDATAVARPIAALLRLPRPHRQG